MTALADAIQDRSGPLPGKSGDPPAIEVVPVHNEERDLERGVRRLHAYLAAEFPFRKRVTLADNASTDGTWAAAARLGPQVSFQERPAGEQAGQATCPPSR